MGCIPLKIQPGPFETINKKSWSNAPSTVKGDKKVTLNSNGIQITTAAGTLYHQTVGGYTSKYMFIGSNNYLLLLDMQDPLSQVNIEYRVYVVNFSAGAPTERLLITVLSPKSMDPPCIEPSQGTGTVFLVYTIGANSNSQLTEYTNTAIYRSDNGDKLLSAPYSFLSQLDILGEATTTELLIHYNQYLEGPKVARCPLPKGECIVPSVTDFKDIVWDGPEDKTKELTVKLQNSTNATDCLEIVGVTDNNPFMVSSPKTYPIYIPVGGHLDVKIIFSPPGLGSYQRNLSIDNADPSSDSQIHCTGIARKSHAICKISANGPVPDVVFGMNSNNTSRCSYVIENMSDNSDLLKVESIKDSQHFSVVTPPTDYSSLLKSGDRLLIEVEFAPTSIGKTEEDLQVISTPPNGDSKIHIIGNARGPNLGISAVSSGSFTTYCFRRKRVSIPLTNTGEVPLTIDVTGPASGLFEWTPINPIPVNTSQMLDILVWSDHVGNFSESLTIHGTYHLVVKDKQGNVQIDQVLETSCVVTVSGTVIQMPSDNLEPNDDFASSTEVDLPMPKLFNPVERPYAGLSLDDSEGNDIDFFAVSYQCLSQDDNSYGGGTTELGMGIVMQTYPPNLAILTNTRPENRDDDKPFTRKLKIYKSDMYNRSLFSTSDGSSVITCPSRVFADKRLYAEISNPDYHNQGPIEYDILFKYTPFRATLSGGQFTPVRYIKLKKYFEAIWRVDPPHDPLGNEVTPEAWAHGTPIAVPNIKSFIKKHLEFVSQTDILVDLHKSLSTAPEAILASEYYGLAQIARAAGLVSKAEELYKQSAALFSKIGRYETQADALCGLIGLYMENGLFKKTVNVKRILNKTLNKTTK